MFIYDGILIYRYIHRVVPIVMLHIRDSGSIGVHVICSKVEKEDVRGD
jgi:hypothetical protein